MFSIIIPLYNKYAYIQRAIDSVLNQSFKDYEIIVVNDGSTDGGDELVDWLYEDKIKLINQDNQGVSMARNRGIKEAKYPWIAFLDADDYWHPDYLETMVEGISKFPTAAMFGCSYSQRKEDLGKVDQAGWFEVNDYFKRAIVNTLFFTSATIIRKEFFLENPGFDGGLARGEDLDVWFRAVLFFGKPVYNFSKLVYYSQDDPAQATNTAFPVEKSLSSKILSENYFPATQGVKCENFEVFRKRYVYFNLLPYLRDSQNDEAASKLLEKLKGTDQLLRSVYLLPFGILRKLMWSSLGKNFIRNYLKFCLRYIYKA